MSPKVCDAWCLHMVCGGHLVQCLRSVLMQTLRQSVVGDRGARHCVCVYMGVIMPLHTVAVIHGENCCG